MGSLELKLKMSWIAITLDSLNEANVATLVDACSNAARAEGQPSRAPGLIQGVVNEIRNAVATCPRNQVDADPTKIPESLRDLAVDLIIARLKGAVSLELTQDERTEVAFRRQQLRDIAACDLVVDQPDVAVTPPVQGGPHIETPTKSPRVASRQKLDGLM